MTFHSVGFTSDNWYSNVISLKQKIISQCNKIHLTCVSRYIPLPYVLLHTYLEFLGHHVPICIIRTDEFYPRLYCSIHCHAMCLFSADIEEQVIQVILDLACPDSLDDYRTEAVAVSVMHYVQRTLDCLAVVYWGILVLCFVDLINLLHSAWKTWVVRCSANPSYCSVFCTERWQQLDSMWLEHWACISLGCYIAVVWVKYLSVVRLQMSCNVNAGCYTVAPVSITASLDEPWHLSWRGQHKSSGTGWLMFLRRELTLHVLFWINSVGCSGSVSEVYNLVQIVLSVA